MLLANRSAFSEKFDFIRSKEFSKIVYYFEYFEYIPYILTFHDGGCYHIETSSLICRANQWTGFYMITASVMKGLNK